MVTTRFNWRFSRNVPPDWFSATDVQTKRAKSGGLVTRTGRSTYEYELATKVALQEGPYLFRFHGRILRGGLSLEALDMRQKVARRRLLLVRAERLKHEIAVPFSVKRAGTVGSSSQTGP
jgi:hypothetical protein